MRKRTEAQIKSEQKRKDKTVSIGMKIDKELFQLLQETCKYRNTTFYDVVRELLNEWLEKNRIN